MVALSAFDDAIEEMIDSVARTNDGPSLDSSGGIRHHNCPTTADATQPYLAARMKAAQSTQDSKTKKIVDSVHQLRREYLYGLEHVHQLTDLEHAPDAILYGNFQDEEPKPQDTSNEAKEK